MEDSPLTALEYMCLIHDARGDSLKQITLPAVIEISCGMGHYDRDQLFASQNYGCPPLHTRFRISSNRSLPNDTPGVVLLPPGISVVIDTALIQDVKEFSFTVDNMENLKGARSGIFKLCCISKLMSLDIFGRSTKTGLMGHLLARENDLITRFLWVS